MGQHDGDAITIADIRPGMRVKIQQRPWVGTITSDVLPGGTFTAVREGESEDIQTSWAVSQVWTIRRLPEPLPTEPGVRFWGKADDLPEPQWWFVQAAPGWSADASPSYLVYVPSRGGDAFNESCCLNASIAELFGLVRLPDPAEAAAFEAERWAAEGQAQLEAEQAAGYER